MSTHISRSAQDDPPACITPRRVTLALLALPPLIALMVLTYATLMHTPCPVHTGDALLDAYLQALVDHSVVGSIESMTPTEKKETLPSAVWQGWDKQHGADPRYWMLCYYLRPHDPAFGKDAPLSYMPDVNYLREARARGAADWTVLLALLHSETSDWSETARSTLALGYPSRNSTLAERQRYHARLWKEVFRVHGAELTQLLDELRRAGADQAQAHYYLAQIEFERGDMAGALQELAAGNAAPHNDAGLGAPFDALTAAGRGGQPLAGDSAIAGQMAAAHMSVPVADFLHYKNMVRTIADWALQQQDLAALQALHRCCCRYGVSEGAGYLQATIAVNAEEIVLDAVRQITSKTPASRMAAYNAAQIQLGKIQTVLNKLGPSSKSLPAMPGVWGMALELTPATSCGGRYFTLSFLRGYAKDLIREQTALAGPVRHEFEALAAIDFTH